MNLVFTAALFTIARTWRQPKMSIHRETDKDDVVRIHDGRNVTVPFAETWMDLETVTQSEVSQKQKQTLYINAYM